eukprot:807593-Amphidinium_carterae.1
MRSNQLALRGRCRDSDFTAPSVARDDHHQRHSSAYCFNNSGAASALHDDGSHNSSPIGLPTSLALEAACTPKCWRNANKGTRRQGSVVCYAYCFTVATIGEKDIERTVEVKLSSPQVLRRTQNAVKTAGLDFNVIAMAPCRYASHLARLS